MRILPSIFLLLVSFLYLIFLLSSTNAHTSKVLCFEKEKQALLDFKLGFADDPFGVLSTWNIHNVDCCDWSGVQCDNRTGHVVELELQGGYHSNKLRPSLLELQHLTRLDLSQNQNRFTMRIPEFIGSLSKLTHLDLSSSGFFGEIPPHLANLSTLQYLDLSQSNGLYSDKLQFLSGLSSISYLGLSDVDLSNAIDWASTLKMLPVLSEFHCRSCSLPPPLVLSFSHLNVSSSLQYLDLSNNTMSSSSFSFLINGTSNLQILSLDYMKLEYNHDEFLETLIERAKSSLEELSLVGNNLRELPSKVMMFPSLTALDASFNRISGSLSQILQYLPKNLLGLDLSSNLLNDVISDAHFSMFSQLQDLYLSDNILLTFNFSKSWVPPFQLNTLHLSSCKVGPNFPNWILTQKGLTDLDISNSMISGDISNAFWEFTTGLTFLNISHNNFRCKIPNLSVSYGVTTHIDLSSNNFHGPIPLFLFNATVLDLLNNKFSSFSTFHPTKLSPEIQFKFINLSGNRLTGTLPNWLFQLDDIISLNLENNKLSGTLPETIGSLEQLSALHLSNNRFSGPLPLSMKNCTHLTILELASNRFSGVVPSWLGESMTNLVVLNLRSNNFSGKLPSTLCHLQNIQILDLSDNEISGSIPSCLHNFSSMVTKTDLNPPATMSQFSFFDENGYVLIIDYASVIWKGVLADLNSRGLDQRNVINLSGNGLVGEIPIGVTALKELTSLDLSINYLNGSIPDQIGRLKSLELLKLSSNRLCGEIPESLAGLTFLGTLNLSNNNLSGKIPSSTQLQGFDPSSYAGNPNLCGLPLPTKCPGDDKKQPPSSATAHEEEEGDESFDIQPFLAALGAGFALSFLGVLGLFHFIRPWRIAFFQLADTIADWIFVTTSLSRSRIKRSLCFAKATGAANR